MAPAPLARLLLDAFTWFDEGLLASLAAAGSPRLTPAQSLVMAHLDGAGTRSAEVARRVGVSRQAIHRTVSELADLGLVSLEEDPANASARLVVLTDLGRATVTAALSTFQSIESTLAKRLGDPDVAALRRILSRDWGDVVVTPAARRRG